MRYVELYYPDLHVEFDYGDVDWETRRGKKEFDQHIEYTYKVSQNLVEETILNLLSEEEYQEIIRKNTIPWDPEDEIDSAYEYIHYNFDDYFEKYQKEILDEFRDDAEEEARKTIDPEDYGYIPLEESKEMRPTDDIEELAKIIADSFIGPSYRGAKYPTFDKASINISKFPDVMRPKYYQTTVVDDSTIQLDYITQEPFYPDDTEVFLKELKRALPEIAKSVHFSSPFTLVLNVEARDGEEYGYAVEDIEVDPTETLQEDLDGEDKAFDDVTRNKFEFLKDHKTHDGKFSKDVKVWDLDLTPKQEDYFYEFLESGFLESFWEENKELAKDIYQEGRSMGHLVLGGGDWRNEPDYYEADRFLNNYIEECFADWFDDHYGMSPEDYEESWPEDFEDAKEEFIEWVNDAYEAVTGFDERADELVELFKQTLDDFIEQEEAPSDDLTETMFSEVEDIEEPELDKPEHDEINESYFDPAAKYLVVDVSGNYLNDFEDADEAIGWAEANWKAFEVQEITDDSAITIWRRNGFPYGDEDDFDECYDDASDELPELEESVDFNPDFDDDFAGHHYTSYDLYKAQQEEEEKEYSDEEAFEERDPNRYDDEHAKEWMKKHPHGWYNSESDYGVGDEEDEEEELEEDWERPHHKFENYSLQDEYGRQIASTSSKEAALEYVEEDDIAGEVQKIVHIFPDSTKDTIVWVKEKGQVNVPYDESLKPTNEAINIRKWFKRKDKKDDSQPVSIGDVDADEYAKTTSSSTKPGRADNRPRLKVAAFENLKLKESYFDYNKYEPLPHDVIDFARKIAEEDITEGVKHWEEKKQDGWLKAKEELDLTVDWVIECIENKFPNWKWDDAKKDAINTLIDDIFDNLQKQNFNEGVISDLDVDVQEAGDKDALITKLEYDTKKLRQEIHFLTDQAPREVGKGGAFDSQEEINDALNATKRALNRAELKLSILRGNK